jgi:hypothetical protein
VVDSSTSLKREDRLTRAGDFRLNHPRHMIYIDDFAGVCLERDRPRLGALQLEYEAVMDGMALPPKPAKTVTPCCDGVEVVGVVVHGIDLTVGVSLTKLLRLTQRTILLLERGSCRGTDFRRLLGHWSWAFLPRRPAFSCFSAVYRFMETAERKVFDIWPSVARELRVAVGLAPLLYAKLDAPWFAKVMASDASGSGQGVVAADCSPGDLEVSQGPAPP